MNVWRNYWKSSIHCRQSKQKEFRLKSRHRDLPVSPDRPNPPNLQFFSTCLLPYRRQKDGSPANDFFKPLQPHRCPSTRFSSHHRSSVLGFSGSVRVSSPRTIGRRRCFRRPNTNFPCRRSRGDGPSTLRISQSLRRRGSRRRLVRTSCGCNDPSSSKDNLATHETAVGLSAKLKYEHVQSAKKARHESPSSFDRRITRVQLEVSVFIRTDS